jgi:hypothetical protein
MDYGFTHQGKTFTPNGTQGITPAENDDRNKTIERAELARWQTAPDTFVAYYTFPQGTDARVNRFAELKQRNYELWCAGETRAGDASCTTWLGTKIGTIVSARVYRHNLGGRFVCLQVRGTNGASYYGRASWDNGTVVRLRRKGSKAPA